MYTVRLFARDGRVARATSERVRRPSARARGRDRSMSRANGAFVGYRAAFALGKTGRGRSVKYYLVDAKGEETLAAYADESTPGDSHYTYKNHEQFTSYGTLTCHNRKALHAWLDEIVRASSGVVTHGPMSATGDTKVKATSKKKKKSGQGPMRHNGLVMSLEAATSGAAAAVTVTTTKPDGTPLFVSYSQEKFTFPDGRRGIRFYVHDESGSPTLAVLGEERETRDGHYQYRRVDTFNAGVPLRCGNLSGVHKWLKDHIAGGQLVGASFPYAGASGGYDKDGSSAASLAKRKRGDIADGVSLIDPAVALQTKIEEREAQWALARRAALAYVREPTHPDHVAELEEIIPVLNSVKGENTANVSDLLGAVKAFRTLNSVYVSLHTLNDTEIKDIVVALQKHPNETISQLAKKHVAQWLGALHSHVGTLASVYQRPVIQAPRHKAGYGPPKEGGTNGAKHDEMTAPSLRQRAVTPTPTISGVKRSAEEALPSTAQQTPPKTKSAGLPGCTPLGKGHKLCPQCSGSCGSPTRVCPHCGAQLPYKSPARAKSEEAQTPEKK